MKLLLLACLPAIAMAACASDLTPREVRAAYSERYTEHPLSVDRYRIDVPVEGRNYRRAYDLALRRAAQIALEEGYPTFEIVNRNSAADRGAKPTTANNPEAKPPHARECGLIGCPKAAKPFESTKPDANTHGPRKSHVSLEILLTRDGADGSANRYDAAEVVSATRPAARG